ncbi:MAG: dipicolinate synthase subunit B, partial [Sporolactobacillus sp.]|nr:dipicolinate synthase subunit B [Sporolactobacillus sp.]
AGAVVSVFVTYTVKHTVSRFGKGSDWIAKVEEMTGRNVIDSIVDAEPFGPRTPLDCMIIAPMTGNSLSKMANAQTDSPVLMAAKATLRNGRPVVLGISTNDGLSLNLQNIAKLIVTKNIYFIPFGQDDPFGKPNSLVGKMDLMIETIESAIAGRQFQPVLVDKTRPNAE